MEYSATRRLLIAGTVVFALASLLPARAAAEASTGPVEAAPPPVEEAATAAVEAVAPPVEEAPAPPVAETVEPAAATEAVATTVTEAVEAAPEQVAAAGEAVESVEQTVAATPNRVEQLAGGDIAGAGEVLPGDKVHDSLRAADATIAEAHETPVASPADDAGAGTPSGGQPPAGDGEVVGVPGPHLSGPVGEVGPPLPTDGPAATPSVALDRFSASPSSPRVFAAVAGATAASVVASGYAGTGSGHANRPAAPLPDRPAPLFGSPGSASGLGGPSSVPLVALLALLALAAPAILRRLGEAPTLGAPCPFVCALERPG